MGVQFFDSVALLCWLPMLQSLTLKEHKSIIAKYHKDNDVAI